MFPIGRARETVYVSYRIAIAIAIAGQDPAHVTVSHHGKPSPFIFVSTQSVVFGSKTNAQVCFSWGGTAVKKIANVYYSSQKPVVTEFAATYLCGAVLSCMHGGCTFDPNGICSQPMQLSNYHPMPPDPTLNVCRYSRLMDAYYPRDCGYGRVYWRTRIMKKTCLGRSSS